ncbi:MAG: hypothetical protein H6Q66_149 [Firmicutes bacterium]|nr:hypothetical protein [Bacillota bacterium]
MDDAETRNNFSKANPFIRGNKAIAKVFTENAHHHVLLQKGAGFCPDTNDPMIGYITRGILKISIANADGEEKLIWFLDENSVISSFRKCFYKEAVAIKPTEILIIKKDIFIDFMMKDRQCLDYYLEQLYTKIEYCMDTLLIQDKKSSKSKVYTLLQQLAKAYGTNLTDNEVYIKKILTGTEMSSITGVHRSNIARYISELEHMNIVKREKNSIILRKPQLLDKLIEAEEI